MAYVTALSVTSLNRAAVAEAAAHQHGAAGHVHAAGLDAAGADLGHAAGHDDEGQDTADPCRPTATQLRAAGELVADTSRALARFADLPDALAVGYAPQLRKPQAVKRHFNPAHVSDGRVLDPARPEGLLYAFTTRGPVVVAAVYLMNRAGEPGRAVGGCMTRRHRHDNLCSSDPAQGLITGVRAKSGRCPPGQVPWAAPPMLHTWVIDIPGPFRGAGAPDRCGYLHVVDVVIAGAEVEIESTDRGLGRYDRPLELHGLRFGLLSLDIRKPDVGGLERQRH
jgi:hypothetical protein